MVASFRHGSHALLKVAKLALPLAAIAVLSTVFLVSRSIDPSRAVEVSDRDISEMTRDPRVRGARFAGITSDDAAILIEADNATMSDQTALDLTLDNIAGQVDMEGRGQILFSAQTGQIDRTANWLTLQEDVSISTSDGYEVDLPVLRMALDEMDIRGDNGVEGRGPAGQLRADVLRITRSLNDPGGYLLAFSGNVRLIYDP